jgi:hypothetical protein
MSEYEKELERRVEELQQKLAEKQDKMPRWVTCNAGDDCVTLFYILDGKMFGFIQYNETVPTHVTGNTKLGSLAGHSIEEAKRHIEQDFLNMFLARDP